MALRCMENNVTLSSDVVVVNNLIMFAYTQNYVECGLFSEFCSSSSPFFLVLPKINFKLSENDAFQDRRRLFD